LFANVGAVAVFQTTPFAEMLPPPALTALPPLVADDDVMEDIAVVATDAVVTATPDAVGADAVR
jgi:hypothetical protein